MVQPQFGIGSMAYKSSPRMEMRHRGDYLVRHRDLQIPKMGRIKMRRRKWRKARLCRDHHLAGSRGMLWRRDCGRKTRLWRDTIQRGSRGHKRIGDHGDEDRSLAADTLVRSGDAWLRQGTSSSSNLTTPSIGGVVKPSIGGVDKRCIRMGPVRISTMLLRLKGDLLPRLPVMQYNLIIDLSSRLLVSLLGMHQMKHKRSMVSSHSPSEGPRSCDRIRLTGSGPVNGVSRTCLRPFASAYLI